MKKLIAIFLFFTMILTLGACGQGNVSENTTPTENITNTSVPSENSPNETNQVIYEANLPDDIVLSIKDNETSVLRKRAKDIFADLDVIYAERTGYKESEYPNGVPYTLWYRGDTTEGTTFVTLNEWFESDMSEVFLQGVTVQFDAYNCPDISILGITNSSTEEDVFRILGSPDTTLRGDWGLYEHYWGDVQIGDFSIECISVDIRKDVVVKFSIDFVL